MNNDYINLLKSRIAVLQDIQKAHCPTDSAWLQASELLAPLFAEMATIANGKPL